MRRIIKILILFGLMLFTLQGCKEEVAEKGSVLFYTNAQAMLNCGPFDVNVYVEDELVGILSEPYVKSSEPECIQTFYSVFVNNNVGTYRYKATFDCGNYGEWTGEVIITSGSCIKVFLDVENCSGIAK